MGFYTKEEVGRAVAELKAAEIALENASRLDRAFPTAETQLAVMCCVHKLFEADAEARFVSDNGPRLACREDSDKEGYCPATWPDAR
jgi:hypothetical protein